MQNWPLFVFLAAAAIPLLVIWRQWSKWRRLWGEAYLAGVQISMFDLMGMTMRKVDSELLVRCLIRLHQGGADVSLRQLESGYLQGVNIENVTTAALIAQHRNLKLSFQELIATDLEGQLAQALGISPESLAESHQEHA